TTSINNLSILFPNATAIDALSALARFDSLQVGGGHGDTGTTLSNTGDISANGNLIIDGISTLTGNITAGGDLEVQGGDITTNQTTFNLLNSTATTVNAFGAGTAITIGAGTGTTTLNNNLSVNLVDNNTDA